MAILIFIVLLGSILISSKLKSQKEPEFPKSYLISLRNRPRSTNDR
jgi:hypothetical protein